jgi:hypothetical protein
MKISETIGKFDLRDSKPFFEFTKKWIDYVTSKKGSADITETEWSELFGRKNPVAGIDRGELLDEVKISNGQMRITNEKQSIISNWDTSIRPFIEATIGITDTPSKIAKIKELDKLLHRTIKNGGGRNMVIAVNRILATFFPDYFVSIPNYENLKEFIKALQKQIDNGDTIIIANNWIDDCYQVKRFFDQELNDDHLTASAWRFYEYIKDTPSTILPIVNLPTIPTMDNHTQYDAFKKLLLCRYNLIFNGAPGTGKTYLAKQVAAQIIYEGNVPENFEEDAKFMEQCGFVQFHPSYDYTDFVEGLRPTRPNKDGNIGFERKDGIFKAFCKRTLDESDTESDEIISLDYNDENDKVTKAMKWLMTQNGSSFYSHKRKTEMTLVIKGDKIYSRISNGEEYPVSLKKIERYLRTGDYNERHDTYAPSVGNFIKENCPLYRNDSSNAIPNNDYSRIGISETKGTLPYIFIIDEINRGEISKIFGELFFSVDPGYRGKKGRVQTQYQNLITDETDPFKEGFYIPENVYIIGTMNDIDRSVECMDFAMRRRFTFKEITAEESASNMELGAEATERMMSLNNAISNIDGFNSSFHIGAAYFKDVDDFDALWELKLTGLLKEYLRGMPDAKESLEALKKAYYLSEE